VSVTAANAEPLKLRVGYDVIPLHLAPVIFELKDEMRHYGTAYTVEFIKFRGSSFQLQALAAKELDLAVLAYSTFATGVLNAHLPLRAVADVAQDGLGFSTVYAVLDDSPIRKIEDLKGRTVAVNGFGGAVDTAARSVLLSHGLNPRSDVTLIETGFATMEPMLREKKIDVAAFLAPFWASAESRGNIRKLFEQRDGLGTTQFLLYASTEDFTKQHRNTLVKFFADYLRGFRAARDPKNRERVLKIIAKLTQQPESAFAPWALLEGKDYHHDPDGLINAEALQKNIDQLAKLEMIPKTFDIHPYVDNSLIKDAAKD